MNRNKIIGLAFGFLSLFPALPTLASDTFQWAITSATTTQILSSTDDAVYQGVSPVGYLRFNGSTFAGFPSLSGINFIDLKLGRQSNSLNWNVPYYVTVSSTYLGDGVCNMGVYGIATSSNSWTQNEIYDAGLSTSTGWTRFYFDEPWSYTLGVSNDLYICINASSTSAVSYGPYLMGNSWSRQAGYADYIHVGSGYYGLNAYGWSIRIGTDDFADVSYSIHSNVYITSDDPPVATVQWRVWVSPLDALAWDELWVNWKFDILKDDGTHDYVTAFDSKSSVSGELVFAAEVPFDNPGRVRVYDVTLSGASGVSSEDILRTDDYVFVIGSTTVPVYSGLEEFLQGNEDDILSLIGGTGTTSPCSAQAWLSGDWGIGNLASCVASVFLPNNAQIARVVAYATSSVFAHPPIGYINRLVQIVALDTGTTTLGSVVLSVPPGLPGAGRSVNLSPWQPIRNAFYHTPSGVFITAATSSTLWESIEPMWNLLWGIFFTIFFVVLIIRFRP